MKMSNYSEVRDALYHRESFVHGSCNARRDDYDPEATYPEATGKYQVWSYNTLVLVYSLKDHRVTMFDNRYYSNTTSRLQAMIRAAFPDATGGHTDRVVYDY
jgi:hypothetical protein